MDSSTQFQMYAVEYLPSDESTEEITQLCRSGLEAWFNMDFRHLTALLRKSSIGASTDAPIPQLQFLRESLQDDPSLEVYEQLYATFLFLNDLDAAYGCIGAAIGSIWASGRDFRRYGLWLSRTDFLLKRKREASPLAVASLLGYKAIAEVTGQGDFDFAVRPYSEQQLWAEKSGSVSLRLLHTSTAAFCSLWAGELTSTELLLTEGAPLSKLSNMPVLSVLLHQSCLGLCRVIKGDTVAGISLLEGVVEDKVLRSLPLPVYLHLYTNYLYGLCMGGNRVKVQEVVDIILEKTIPVSSYYHLAWLYFCLSIASLRLGKPRKALLYSDAAEQRGKMSGSPIIQRIAALIRGQALADLQENEKALTHFSTWMPCWQEKGLGLFAVTGALEMAGICLRLGKVDTAARYFEKAGEILPRGESLVTLYRNGDFVGRIRKALHTGKTPAGPVAIVEPVMSIQTLGGFSLTINGQLLEDSRWHGRRSKQLLKAIIALGGTRVSLEKLSCLLWPDSDGDRGMNNLKTTLSRLRRVGGDDCSVPSNWLVVKHRRVSLAQSVCRIDALEFCRNMERVTDLENAQSMQQTLALYKHDFLVNDEEAWIVAFRDHLHKLFVDGVLRLASLEHSEEEVVLVFLEQARHADPLHEGVYGCLMEHYINAGFPAYALNMFSKAEKAISLQTGLHPGPYLQSLALQAKRLSS